MYQLKTQKIIFLNEERLEQKFTFMTQQQIDPAYSTAGRSGKTRQEQGRLERNFTVMRMKRSLGDTDDQSRKVKRTFCLQAECRESDSAMCNVPSQERSCKNSAVCISCTAESDSTVACTPRSQNKKLSRSLVAHNGKIR